MESIEETRSARARQHNVGVVYSAAKIAEPEQIADAISLAESELGGVDIPVNNAGIQHVAPIEEFPVEKRNAIIAIKLSGSFHTTRLAVRNLPALRADAARACGISEEAVIRDVLLAAQPTKRFVEVAGLTAFLCSLDAGSIAGTLLPVDGGWTAHWPRLFRPLCLLSPMVSHHSGPDFH